MKDSLIIIVNIIFIVLMIRAWMFVARYIGEQLGISRLIEFILSKLKKKN